MTQQDLFYRAFNEYKKHTKTSVECVHFCRSSQTLKSRENELVKAVFATCTIQEDWIKAIEEGLPFIYKAIKEERQFIRNDGEVLPIEKVRKTSKYTIQDLAKHSNYISHEAPEHLNADIMPDKVLVIKKENDYTVYENRVVYALLVYLQEFVAARLSKIKELTNKYEASAMINKNIVLNNRNLSFQMKLDEIIKNDPIAIKRNKYHDLIDRIDAIYSQVISLLKTPLMWECSKVDTVSRPITKTNVLRMNRNFKESLKLFDYIAEYKGDGYVVTIEEKVFNPLSLPVTYDYSELMQLASFITYMHVNGITEELKEAYNIEEKRLKKIEEDKLLAKVKRISNLAAAKGKTLHEYVLILDEANKILDKRNNELIALMEEEEKLHKQEIEQLNQKHDEYVNELNQKHEEYVNELNNKHQDEVNTLNLNHQNEIEQLNQSHEQEITTLKSEHDETVRNITTNYENKISDLNNELANLKSNLETTITSYEEKLKTINNETQEFKENLINVTNHQVKEANDAQYNAETELFALRLKHGLKADPKDFTTKERFTELEKEKKCLDELFNKAWKETKKQIRKNVMSEKPQKLFKNKKDNAITNETSTPLVDENKNAQEKEEDE